MFRSLDYLYTPSADVAADVGYATDVLGASLVFAIEAMGTRVAMVELGPGPPSLVFAGHLQQGPPILVYRVDDLDSAVAELTRRGWRGGHALEIPQGPVRSFTAPGGHRLAIYELTRPGVVEGFRGRRDF
ncbi:MAG TPA: hypothetical protein VIV06_07355 [Candidatus Limnocylindrales bacterium]